MKDNDWIKLLAGDPKHREVWTAYAEWLQDECCNTKKANAVRWMTKNKRFPVCVSSAVSRGERSWDWSTSNPQSVSNLPEHIWNILEKGNGVAVSGWHEYNCPEDALEDLIESLMCTDVSILESVNA